MEITSSIPSAMVAEGRWDKIAVMHDSYLRTKDKQDQVIIGRVVCINSDHVVWVATNKWYLRLLRQHEWQSLYQ